MVGEFSCSDERISSVTAQGKEKLVTEIIDDALGDLSHWSMPVVIQSIGPNYPELAEQFSKDIKSTKRDIREILSIQSVENLKTRYIAVNHHGVKSLRDSNGVDFQMVAKIVALTRREPAWFFAGWHVKKLELDVPH